MTKTDRQNNMNFRLMALEFRIRDWLRPPMKILRKAGVLPGMTVLDFGCGPGGYSLAAARLVGPQGLVYALDINRLALKTVLRTAATKDLKNIHPLNGEGIDDLRAESVDIALTYDVLHDFPKTNPVLVKIHRVLKPNGVLSVSDHHLNEASILSMITISGLFIFTGRTKRTFQFAKAEMNGKAI